MTVAGLPLDDLARRCAEETEQFSRRRSHDPRFCFELLRQALAEGVPEAFARVYHVYERQVLNWVYSHQRFEQTGESAEYFASAALSAFYFALRGPKFERFPALAQVLSYLKLCVHTAIAQYLRDQQPAATAILDDATTITDTSDLDAQVLAAELWGEICRLLPDERERTLARCVFLQDLKPRQIVQAHPKQWNSEREVSVALYRIRRVLRNDLALRRRAGVDAQEGSIERVS